MFVKGKRVIIFSTAYLPLIGGAELAIKEITDRISDFEFDLICARLRRDLPKQEKIGNVNVYRVGFGNNFDKILLPFFGFLKARKIYNLSKIQNLTSKIYIWGIMASWGSLAGLVLKTFYSRVPFLLTLQEGDAPEYIQKGRFGLINLSWRLLLWKADYVQAISNYLAKMARDYGYKREIEIIPNGVDLKKFDVANYDSKKLKEELKIKSDEKVIITVSRLVPKNGVKDLIDAIKEYEKISSQKIKFLIVGSGHLKNDLKEQVRNLGLGNKVLFIGEVKHDDVPKYLAVSDLFIRPSLSEGLGTAFIEAMAMGVPTIGTLVGGITYFLGMGFIKLGYMCEKVGDAQEIAKRINNVFLTPIEVRQKLIEGGRQDVKKYFEWEKIALRISNIFQKLIIP